jgi:hypothetical protein
MENGDVMGEGKAEDRGTEEVSILKLYIKQLSLVSGPFLSIYANNVCCYLCFFEGEE